MKNYAFILFHAGETRALLPTLLKMASQPEKYNLRIIPVGQAAMTDLLLQTSLSRYIKIPSFVQEGEGKNDEFNKEFSKHHIEEMIEYCINYNNIVLGYPAKIQEQIAKNLFNKPNKNVIIYFDNGSDENKIGLFAPFSHVLIFTTLQDQRNATQFISKQKFKHQIKIFSAPHGDLESWMSYYKNVTEENKNEIRKKLFVDLPDKIILWVGGYGEKEKISFRMFIESFKNYPAYKLRLTLHPGICTYTQDKLKEIKDDYYINTLKYFGYTDEEINKMITSLPTQQVACIALGSFSAGSSTGKPMVLLGVRVNTLILNHQLFSPGIKNIDTAEKLSEVFARWSKKGRRELYTKDYDKAVKKLGLPEGSIPRILKNCAI